jgi:hypothetical protein
MILLALLLIPTTIAVLTFVFGKQYVTWQEFLSQIGAQTLVMAGAMWALYSLDTVDTEIWAGRVSNKAREEVSCSHSYTCNCVTSCSGSGSNQSCSTSCQTCYEHSYDVDWAVYTTNSERLEIDRVSRQGLKKPERWGAVKIGEPTAVAHSYTNYIKAAPDTLFRHQGLIEKYQSKMAVYPGTIYDYYHINRLSQVGINVPDAEQWNRDLEQINADIGKAKQANLAVVLVNGLPDDYFEAVEQEWVGGKKNDVVAMIGTDGQTIQWVRIMAWTNSEMFKVQLATRF